MSALSVYIRGLAMSNELKEKISNLVSYYDYHSIDSFVNGNDEALKQFVVDDFTELLELLSKELEA